MSWIRAYDGPEHIHRDKVIQFMNEAHRVLEPGGIFEIWVPSTDGRGAFQDPTHKSYWNRNSFGYYTPGLNHDLYPSITALFDWAMTETEPGQDDGIIHVLAIGKKMISDGGPRWTKDEIDMTVRHISLLNKEQKQGIVVEE